MSIPDVCSQAGVTARHFYEEFASREALLKQIYDDLSAVLLHRVGQAVFGEDGTPLEVVRAGCAAFAEYLTSDPRRARVFALEVAGISRDLDRHRLKTRRVFAELSLQSSLRLRELSFDPGVDVGVVSTLLTGAADALMSEWALTRKPPVTLLIDTLTTVWIRALQLDRLDAEAGSTVPAAATSVRREPALLQVAVAWPSLGAG